MAYTTYTTEAIVCGTYDRNTADRSYLLFTRDAGMLYAEARGVRKESSKQRHSLQDFSHIRVSLIKGKAGWRIGSVEALGNFFNQADTREARGSVVALFKLVRRFMRGEEPAPHVYDHFKMALGLFVMPLPYRTYTEAVIKLRLLELLGYVSPTNIPPAVFSGDAKALTEASVGLTQAEVERLLDLAITSSHL